MNITRLSERLAVSPQLRAADLAGLAASGFAGIINNRPDGEEPGQPASGQLQAEAERLGLQYWHVPVVPGEMAEPQVRAFAVVLDEARGPVLAFCRTGNRSTNLWKAAQALA